MMADVDLIAKAVARTVAGAPPFTTAQRDRIAAAFTGVTSLPQNVRRAA